MKILSNLPVKYKIVLILLPPIIGLLYFSIIDVIDKVETAGRLQSVQSLAELSVKISALVHETQRERGMTAGYLGSNGEKFAVEIETQRRQTDNKVSELESYLKDFDTDAFGTKFASALDSAMGGLEQLHSRRGQVASMSISTADAIGYYTSANKGFLDVIGAATKLSDSGEITRMTDAYLNFLQAKERAGIERAVLTNTFSRDAFGPGMFVKFTTLVAQQDTYLDNFSVLAANEEAEYFDLKMRAPEIASVERMRQVAFDRASAGGFGIDAGEWFDTITAKINLFKEIENRLSEHLIARAGALNNEASMTLALHATTALLAGLIALLMGFLIARSITRALGSALEALNDIADGEGDLTRRLDDSARDEVGQLAGAFNRFAEKIQTMLIDIRQASQSINTASSEIATGNIDLSSRTEQQSASLEETASSMEELTSTVRQTAGNAKQADQLASSARDRAIQGGSIVAEAVTAMEEISTSSQKIADIIGVIDEIAFQTNLLALNASVEAARAGDQGRGFAVVASEVRSLAQRTASEAKEIRELIKDSVSRVEEGSRLVNQSGESLTEIVESVTRVSDIVAEITMAANEQSAGIEQINQAVTQLDEMTQQNASLVEEAAAASKSLDEQAEGMSQLVSRFVIDGGGSVPPEPRAPREGVPASMTTVTPAPKGLPEGRKLLAVGADESP